MCTTPTNPPVVPKEVLELLRKLRAENEALKEALRQRIVPAGIRCCD